MTERDPELAACQHEATTGEPTVTLREIALLAADIHARGIGCSEHDHPVTDHYGYARMVFERERGIGVT